MPSPEHLDHLASTFEQYQSQLAARIAAVPPGDPATEQMQQMHSLLTESMDKFIAASKEHNKKMAAIANEGQKIAAESEAKVAEKLKNLPKPKPRVVKPKIVADPFLEEKLQLALRTPFGNRSPQTK